MEFLLALQFLTRIPINISGEITEKKLARSMAYFPFIGLIIGITTAFLHYMISQVANVTAADLIAVAFMILITGNMHLDGLMDTADGIYSCRPREGILEIMKDSRVGAHGVAAGVLGILAKYVFLTQIPMGSIKYITILLVPTLSRWTQVYGAFKYPYARVNGGKANFIELVGKREIFWGSVTVLISTYALFIFKKGFLDGAFEGGSLLIMTLLGAIFTAKYLSQKIQGVTGDTLGALTECIEIWVLFLLICMN